MMGCSRLESSPVSARLDVEVLPDRCRFLLIVTNNLDSEVTIQFPTAQQYDFIIKSDDGRIVWQWSKGKIFAQVLTTLILSPNEEKVFVKEHSLPPGSYSAQGIVNDIYTEWVDFIVTEGRQIVLRGKITRILDKQYLLGEDGTAYLIENPIDGLEGKTIEVTSCRIEPIPGTVDKKIVIGEYHD